MDPLDRDHRSRGRMGHGDELAASADPDITGAIGDRRMEQRDIGLMAGSSTMGSPLSAKGLSMMRQSGRWATRSEPMVRAAA